MKPMGWMMIISDLLHGFIDGLTIGAISIISLSEAIQMILPIAFEEFSHKLGWITFSHHCLNLYFINLFLCLIGDTAVLLSSGLTVKQSLLMNFLSSIGLYPGFLLGTKLGERTD